MASAEPVAVPFGFTRPTQSDFGELATTILHRAEDRIATSRRRAVRWALPSLLAYPVFALGVWVVVWASGLELSATVLRVVVAGAFLLLALLGQFYSDRATLADARGGMGPVHSNLLAQAIVVRWITTFFFTLPYRIIRNLASLFPRRPQVDRRTLALASQLSAALDIPVTLRQLRSIVPRELPDGVLQESLLLLRWAGLVNTAYERGRLVVAPANERRVLVAPLVQSSQGVVALSDLLEQPPSVTGSASRTRSARQAGRPAAPPVWLQPVLAKPMRALAVLVTATVVFGLAWHFGSRWYRHLDVTLIPTPLPVAGANGIHAARGNYFLAHDTEIRVTDDLDSFAGTAHSLLMLHKVWSDGTGMDGAIEGARVYFKRAVFGETDPSGHYLLAHGSWTCYRDQNVSCGATMPVVIDLQDMTMMPVNVFEGFHSGSMKGWWGPGELLAVRRAAAWERGGGGRLSSDNLAPEAVAVDVASGRARTVHRPREPYFAEAGEENGGRVFLGVRTEPIEGSDAARLELTEYSELRPVKSFSLTIPAYLPVVRQSELDATGRYWILAIEEPPPPLAPNRPPKQALWLIARSGARWTRAQDLGRRGALLMDAFSHGADSVVTLLTNSRPPESVSFVVSDG